MPKSIPWGNEAAPRSVSMPEASIRGGYSAVSSGPLVDPTPQDVAFHVSISDSPFQMTNFGPPYEVTHTQPDSAIPNAIPPQGDSEFSKLEHKLAGKKGVTNPAGLAAKIGREELGQAEMTRRSVEGKEHKE